MAIYMQPTGLKGNVTETKHKDWIHVESMHYALKSPVHTKVGDTRDRIKGNPIIGEMTIVKEADNSSPHWFSYLLQGKVISSLKIDVCHTGKEALAHEQYTLGDVLVSHYEESHDLSESNPRELIRLNFAKIEKSHTQYDSKGNPRGAIKAGYDAAQASIC